MGGSRDGLEESPKIILETDRLLLQEFSLDDVEGLFALNADPEVMQYTGDKAFSSRKDTEDFILNYQDVYVKYGIGRWSLRCKKDGRYIGWCGLKKHQNGIVDIGFRLLRLEWGRGYATEAASACLTFGRDQLQFDRIIGRCHKDNIASQRVLEKIGFTLQGEAEIDGLGLALIYC